MDEATRQAATNHARREVARAREALNQLTRVRQFPGVGHVRPYWQQVNHVEACIRDAIRAVRFARGTSNIQTFGSFMPRYIRERGMVS